MRECSLLQKRLHDGGCIAPDATARLAALPGVVTASSALDFPPFGGIGTDFEISGETHGAQWKGQMGFIDSQFFPRLRRYSAGWGSLGWTSNSGR
jgi:hypothetical protein